MIEEKILSKFELMPKPFQKEVLDFMEFLIHKHSILKDKEKSGESEPYPRFGSGKGYYIISENFDEPIEDFKDYM